MATSLWFTNLVKLGLDAVSDTWAVKLYGSRATLQFTFAADASSLITCVKLSPTPNAAKFTEITVDSVNVTRLTTTGAAVKTLVLADLTPGTYIAVDVVSGIGTFTWEIVNTQEIHNRI